MRHCQDVDTIGIDTPPGCAHNLETSIAEQSRRYKARERRPAAAFASRSRVWEWDFFNTALANAFRGPSDHLDLTILSQALDLRYLRR